MTDDLGGCINAIERWHRDIDDHEVGALLPNKLKQVPAVFGFTDDLRPAGPGKQKDQAFPDDIVVVCDDRPQQFHQMPFTGNGSSRQSTVPQIVPDWMWTLPCNS